MRANSPKQRCSAMRTYNSFAKKNQKISILVRNCAAFHVVMQKKIRKQNFSNQSHLVKRYQNVKFL